MKTTLTMHADYTHRVQCDDCGHDRVYLNVRDATEDYRLHEYACSAVRR